MLTFFIETQHSSSKQFETRFSVLVEMYLRGTFIVDLIAIIPFYSIFKGVVDEEYNRLFYLIKLVRLPRIFQLMSTKVFMAHVKSYFSKKLTALIKNNEDEANDQK